MSTAGELLKQLQKRADDMSKEHGEDGEYLVALITKHGLIFAWQEHALQNVAFALKHGKCSGFIEVFKEDDNIEASFNLIISDLDEIDDDCLDDAVGEALNDLVKAIPTVWKVLESEYVTEYGSENFQKNANHEATLEGKSEQFREGFAAGLLAA